LRKGGRGDFHGKSNPLQRVLAQKSHAAEPLEKILSTSFLRKQESKFFKVFWTPAPAPEHDPGCAGVTVSLSFAGTIIVCYRRFATKLYTFYVTDFHDGMGIK
jgi:hypothetical protein